MTTERTLRAAKLGDAFAYALALLDMGTEEDLASGPRWTTLTDEELFEHLREHVASVENDIRGISDLGLLEAAHVAVRGLMVLQRAIERDRDTNRCQWFDGDDVDGDGER